MMLSGFLFDLRSMPDVVRWITYLLPARYYVALLQTIFLAGDIWGVICAERRPCSPLWRRSCSLPTRAVTRKKLA